MTDAANYHQVTGHVSPPCGSSNITAKGNSATEKYKHICLLNAISVL
jgi:hypothetical protein